MTEPALLQELRKREIQLHQPSVRDSREALERLLHADFVEVSRSGRRYTRDKMIALLLAEPGVERVESQDYQVLALSPDAALLTYRSGGV